MSAAALAAIATGLRQGPLGIASASRRSGLFGSIYHPVGIAWLVRNAENRGRMLGWNGIFGSIGVGVASVVAGALDALWIAGAPPSSCRARVRWRSALALVVLVRGGTWWRQRPTVKPQPEPERGDVRRAFIVLSVTMLCAGIMCQSLTVALPKLFEQRLTDLTRAARLAPGGFAAWSSPWACSPAVGGWLADRYSAEAGLCLRAGLLAVPALLLSLHLFELPLFA